MGIVRVAVVLKRRPNGGQIGDFRATCDAPGCAASASSANVDRTYFKGYLRQLGWSVGKWVLCPEHKGLKVTS